MEKISDLRKIELRSEIEQIAQDFRRAYNNICEAPIPNSFRAAEELGFFVVSAAAPNELSGFTTTIDNKSMIVVNSNHPLGRQNYSIWHEIYHWYTGDGLEVSLMDNIEYNETEFKAEAFASEILLEKKSLERELNSLGYKSLNKSSVKYLKNEDIVILQNRFNVSYRAMLTRIIAISDNQDLRTRYGIASNQGKIIQFNIKCGFNGDLEKPTPKPYISDSLFKYLTLNLEKGRISSSYVEEFLEFIERGIN